jgi:K+-transporting ATPase c subunit
MTLTTGFNLRPTNEELEKAVQEEYEAMRELAALNDSRQNLELARRAARDRLMRAREAKRALVNDLMTL